MARDDKGLLFFYDWKPVFEELSPEECKNLILSMLEYKQNQTPPPEFTGMARIAALLIFPAIERSVKLSAAGKSGGTKTQASKGASKGASSHGSSTKQNNTETKQDEDKIEDIPLSADSPLPEAKEKPDKRHKHGEYKNVLLSDDDMDTLKAEFPADYGERIERLSSYIASSGKSYKNHLAVIRSWAKRDSAQSSGIKSSEAVAYSTDDFLSLT